MSLEVPNNKLGAKIRWEQIEDGYLVLDFIKKFSTLDTDLRKLANSQNATIKSLQQQVETLTNTLNEFGESYRQEINEKVGDFQRAITALKQYCDETFYEKGTKFGLKDLDPETTALIDAILNAIEELKTDLNNIMYDFDKDGNYRKILWRVYFEVSTDHIYYLKNIDGFKEDMTRYITMEDFYGKNYASENYSNEQVQLFCFGPTQSFISEYEAMAQDYLARAIANVERESIKSEFVPRTYVENNTIYPIHPVLGSVGYEVETRAFDFEDVATTDYLVKVVKFID